MTMTMKVIVRLSNVLIMSTFTFNFILTAGWVENEMGLVLMVMIPKLHL